MHYFFLFGEMINYLDIIRNEIFFRSTNKKNQTNLDFLLLTDSVVHKLWISIKIYHYYNFRFDDNNHY
jgi:hypothetical protein